MLPLEANNTGKNMTNQITMKRPHFVLIPLWAPGHMIPMVDLACLIAERGALVSFITTPINATRIKPVIDHVKASQLQIEFIKLRFPCTEAGLPDGCESFDLITSIEYSLPFLQGLSLLQQPLEIYLKGVQPAATCLISDNCQWWTMKVAEELKIPRLIFHGPSCFFSLCTQNIRQYKVYENLTDDSQPVLVPGLPDRIIITKAQAPGWFEEPGYENFRDNVMKSEETADGVVVNTFKELEPEYVELYEKTIGKKVWPVGPVSLYSKDVVLKAARGKKATINECTVLNWLDSMDPRSVVYVSFGSLAKSGPSQIIEIGCGLEASKKPFIWVIKELEKCPEVDNWISNGFEERTRDRGLVIIGWAPQGVILSHPSVGAFITHCGWNSTLEAISAGVPMITCPHFADQFLNEKLVVEILKIGVSLWVKEPCGLIEEDKVRVKKDEVEKAIVNLMNKGEDAEKRRQRVREFGEMARKAMEEGGSSYEILTCLIHYGSEPAK